MREQRHGLVDSELSEDCWVKVGMNQGSVLSPFLFSVVILTYGDTTRF